MSPEKFDKQINGNTSPSNTRRDNLDSPAEMERWNTITSSSQCFKMDKQELLGVLGHLSKEQLLQTLVALLENAVLPGQARCADEPVGDAQASIGADAPRGIDLGPEYNTRQLAEMGGISRQAVAERVHKLVDLGWLEERCTKRWSFDAEEGAIILRNPRTRGPIKKYSA